MSTVTFAARLMNLMTLKIYFLWIYFVDNNPL